MKPTQVLLALAAIAYAAPVAEDTKVEAVEFDDDFPLAELEAYFENHLNGQASESGSLQARQFSSSTYNQLTDGTPCRPVTMIYARGTTQAGNVGDSAAVGPVLFNNLASRIGLNNLAVQGVTYPANVAGFLAGGDAAGSRTMATLISRAASQCPSTKIIISGYSQGAQLVHNAAGMLSASVANRVTAAVTFGDPKQNEAFGTIPSSRTRVYCRSGDNICTGGIIITPAHSQYQQDAPAAAQWIAARV
ncbi:cutinase [Fusarium longipes]|uniref:Cutinase n=1 Tax=Fusarium longipes TaxID=694270 RepID=A0A395T353_9HYPO|nr:cutinase [Fusarium longipes]